MMTCLRKNSLFSSLSNDALNGLIQHAQHIALSHGETLFVQGDAASHFYWLESGMVKLYRMAPNGDEKIIEIIHPGETFAEAIMFREQQQAHYPVSAQVIQDGEVWRFNNQQFLNLLRHSSETCFNMMASMSQRLHQHIQEIDRLTLQNANERVIHYLLENLSQQPEGSHRLQLSISKQMLASKLSIKPETLSRTLSKLSKEGFIISQGSHIEICDAAALRKQIEI